MEKLYRHQIEFLKKNPKKCLLAWDTGTGKTRVAIEWMKQNRVLPGIICPKALKENWKKELEKWWPEKAEYIAIKSKEEFRKEWDDYWFTNNHALIIDEAHYFAGIKSQMTKSLAKFIKKNQAENILLLTATPYLSTPFNIYCLARHLGYEWNYMAFQLKYFNMVHMGARIIPVVKRGIKKDMAKLVAKIGDVVRLEDCIDVPEQQFLEEYFEPTAEQEKAIKILEEPNPLTRFIKEHQILQGALLGGEYAENKFYASNKLERLKELAMEHKKLAIVCRYNLQIDYISKHLNAIKRILIIRGDVEDRDSVIREAEKLDECIILIQAACSEGYELPSFGLIIFASLSFSYKDYKQICGRFLRINKPKKNVYLHLICGNIDREVYKAMQRKEDFDVAVFNRK